MTDQNVEGGTRKRLVSLDALRGLNMLFIMGGAELFIAIAALWPDSSFWQGVRHNMNHVAWDGFAHHDLIFPMFLFIAGVAFPFSLAKQRDQGKSTCSIVRKILLRGLILVLLGILYNNCHSWDAGNRKDFSYDSFRLASVLGHIGLAWMFAALITLWLGVKSRTVLVAAILLGYWWAMATFVAPDAPEGAGPFSQDGSLAGYIDRLWLPGSLHNGNHDPEGLFTLLTSTATALMGGLTGEFLRVADEKISGGRKVITMIVAGSLLVAVAILWNRLFPINKNLWTSPFVCLTGGISILSLAVFYAVIDVWGWRKWAFPFVVIGMNSITIYLAQNFINFDFINWFAFGKIYRVISDGLTFQIIHAVGYIVVCWLFLFLLYRKRVFLKV